MVSHAISRDSWLVDLDEEQGGRVHTIDVTAKELDHVCRDASLETMEKVILSKGFTMGRPPADDAAEKDFKEQDDEVLELSSGFRIVNGKVVEPELPDGLYRDDPEPKEGFQAATRTPPLNIWNNNKSSKDTKVESNFGIWNAGPSSPHSTYTTARRQRKIRFLSIIFGVIPFTLAMIILIHRQIVSKRLSKEMNQYRFQVIQDRLQVDSSDPFVHQTLDWLKNQPSVLSMDDMTLEQYYAVVLLYYSTSGPTRWTQPLDFLTATSVCDWNNGVKGVFCNDDGVVTKLDLHQNHLDGRLPPDLARLSQLQHVALWGNSLRGNLPEEWASLTHLDTIFLSQNELSGTLPTALLGSLSNLSVLILSTNQLEGKLAPDLGRMTSLTYLYLGENAFTGSIPSQLGQLTQLEHLRLSQNQLKGTIPSTFGNLQNLVTLNLQGNTIHGSIPSELGNLAALQDLSLGPSKLTGSIPAEIASLSDLGILHLQSSQLSGDVPEGIWGLTKLGTLELSSNPYLQGTIGTNIRASTRLQTLAISRTSISGTLPTELGELLGLRVLDVAHTLLTGAVPTELSHLYNLDHLLMNHNDLTGDLTAIFCSDHHSPSSFEADCMSDATVVLCDCCTKCY